MNSSLWDKILARFTSIWALHNITECILLTDNLRFHHNLNPIIVAKNKLVHMVFLPPNTSHFLQPLDDLVFARYKTHLARLARELAAALHQQGDRMTALEIITAVTAAAEEIAFKEEIVRKSFENCGLWPLNPEKIMTLAYLNIAKQDPAETTEKPTKLAKGDRISKKEYIRKIQNVMTAYNTKNANVLSSVKQKNVRVSATTEYESMWDTASTMKKGNSTAENARVLLQRKQEKLNVLKQKKELIDQKIIERSNMDEAKATRGFKRDRDGNFGEPGSMEVRYIVKECKYWWNAGTDDNWRFCDHCDANGVCAAHWDEGPEGSGQRVLEGHEERCPRRPKKKQKLD